MLSHTLQPASPTSDRLVECFEILTGPYARTAVEHLDVITHSAAACDPLNRLGKQSEGRE